MGNSEDQFQELLAQLVGRANRMLAARSQFLPMGLLLMPDGSLDVSVVTYETADQVPALLNAMQLSIAGKARGGNAVASCVAYLDHDADEIIALLENRENYCATVSFPLVGSPPAVDVGGITVKDGFVHVFPVSG